MAELKQTRVYGKLTVDDDTDIDGLLRPLTDNTKDIGSSSYRWRDLRLSRDILMDGSVKDGAGANATTPANLKTAYDHSQNVTGAVHGAVSAATANMIARRDSGGRAKFAAPATDGDAYIRGTTILATDVPNLNAAKITSGRFGMARMPDMDINKVMLGQGSGNDPIEADLPSAEDNYARILTWLGV